MTEELLRLAKAAARLGDRFVPPRGTEVAGRVGYRRGHIGHVERAEDCTLAGAILVRWQGGRKSHVELADLELRKLPDDAPPFDTWERLR